MNACLQCLLPIEELRNHFILREYTAFSKVGTRRKNNFEFCQKFYEFYTLVYSKSSSRKKWVINPELKKVVRRKFDPIVQHDSHEFMLFVFEQLQDEQTPKGAKFDGSDPKKPLR